MAVTGISRRGLKIVGVGAAVGTLILVLVLTIPWSAQPGICSCPIGSAFSVGNPVASVCASGATFSTTGCLAGDFTYNLTIESSTVTFGSVLFHVATPSGAVYVATGGEPGFSIHGSNWAIVAQYATTGGAMAMTSGWTYFGGVNASTPLTSQDSILVDVGIVNPAHQGYLFATDCIESCSVSGPIALP
ncbi:MAG: hypothetical protein WB786_08500 [Thermoplasmata archaeon]